VCAGQRQKYRQRRIQPGLIQPADFWSSSGPAAHRNLGLENLDGRPQGEDQDR